MTETAQPAGPLDAAELAAPARVLTPEGEEREEREPGYDGPAWSLPERMGLEEEVDRLRGYLADYVARTDEDIREMLAYQLSARSKYFRPVTMFACHRATAEGPIDPLLPAAAAAELLHNYATVVDDVVDRDRLRRGKLSLHAKYGLLGATMTSAFLGFAAQELVADDAYASALLADLGKRVCAVECRQWKLRRKALGVETWREIAGEDTGAMFAACAQLATRDDRLARYGYLLGTLYHGCDDVADIRGSLALGAHSDRDITDRILTLVAAIATEDEETARLFAEGGPETDRDVAERLAAALPAAEAALDGLARDAIAEAERVAERPEGLVQLVRYTRELAEA